jgi:hypothetical protein
MLGLLFEPAGKPGTAPLLQMGGMALKMGLIGVFTTTNVVDVPLQFGVV